MSYKGEKMLGTTRTTYITTKLGDNSISSYFTTNERNIKKNAILTTGVLGLGFKCTQCQKLALTVNSAYQG